MSERSLRRKLAELGLSYDVLLDRVRACPCRGADPQLR
jgi:hypothetical protein